MIISLLIITLSIYMLEENRVDSIEEQARERIEETKKNSKND